MDADNQECPVLKILVLGDPSTGKTSIIKRFVHNAFSYNQKPTVGVDFHLKQLQIVDVTVRVQLWDIAGQERFGAITRVYYREAVGAFIVYDVSRPATFETVAKWKEEIDAKIFLPNGSKIPVILLGNKSDLDDNETDKQQLQEFADALGFSGTFDTSAKTDLNIEKAVRALVEKILAHNDIFIKKRAINAAFKPGEKRKLKTGGCC